MMRVLSVVCARAGSKGLKNKCIRKIMGKRVFEYSIEYSKSLGDNVKTVVSTDIDAVIEYCQRNSIDYIKRDAKLCEDNIRIEDVLVDAIEKRGQGCVYCSLVYGNVPIRYPKIFQGALDFLKSHEDYDAVITMQNVEKFHPDWMCDYNTEILPKVKCRHYRRQSLPKKMIHDGHTLLFKIEQFYKKYKGTVPYDKECIYSIYGNKIKPLIVDEVVIDIDTEKDFKLVEAIVLTRFHYWGKVNGAGKFKDQERAL